MNDEYRLSDNVIARIVQIIQEGFITGTDITDHMRMMRVRPDAKCELQLTETYVENVKRGYEKLNEEMAAKREASE